MIKNKLNMLFPKFSVYIFRSANKKKWNYSSYIFFQHVAKNKATFLKSLPKKIFFLWVFTQCTERSFNQYLLKGNDEWVTSVVKCVNLWTSAKERLKMAMFSMFVTKKEVAWLKGQTITKTRLWVVGLFSSQIPVKECMGEQAKWYQGKKSNLNFSFCK